MTDVSLLEVGQWQGSGTPTARRLQAGAARLAELVPAQNRRTVPIESAESDARDGVQNAEVLAEQLRAVREAITQVPADDLLVTVGGDCKAQRSKLGHGMGSERTGSRVVRVAMGTDACSARG